MTSTEFTYNENYDIATELIGQAQDGSEDCINRDFYTYTYDDNYNQNEFLRQQWEYGNWNNYQRTLTSYEYIPIQGDINEDDVLDILDVVLIVNLVLEPQYDEMADLNQDGFLDILDIIILVNNIIDE